MEIIYWVFILIVAVAVLFSIKDFIRFILISLANDGVKFTLFIIVLAILFIAPSVVKQLAPNYYGLSIWVLILYVVGSLFYRHLVVGTHKEDKES